MYRADSLPRVAPVRNAAGWTGRMDELRRRASHWIDSQMYRADSLPRVAPVRNAAGWRDVPHGRGCSAWFRFFLSSLKLQKVLRSLTGWAAVALGMLMCGILEDLNTPHAPARANIGGFGTPRGLC